MLLMFISKTKEKLISDACGIEKWRQQLFVKVSNRQYHPLLDHLGVLKTLLVVWLVSKVVH